VRGQDYAVELSGISKRFPSGVVANDRVDCRALPGQIHAVLGENGAGKTTLMRILAGLSVPDEGSIRIGGAEVAFRSPRDAAAAGIAMVHQHFSLVPALTVADNLALGAREVGAVLSPRRWRRWLEGQAETLGFEIRLESPVWSLSMGERQRVEIFRALLRQARILILDEPTSILAPVEAQRLFDRLRELAAEGYVTFLVTHKIQHALGVADRVTILRRGRVVASETSSDLDSVEIAHLMVGRTSRLTSPPRVRHAASHEPVLEVEDLCVPPLVSPFGLKGVSLRLNAREIVGIAGISGHGQDELILGVVGQAPVVSGTVRQRLEGHGSAYVPEERLGVALVPGMSLADNLALRNFRRPGFSRGPFLKRARLLGAAREAIERFSIAPDDPGVPVEVLSGGNRQKAVLGRELEGRPRLILAQTPTAGLDVATVDLVLRELIAQSAAGAAVLVVSEDLDELLSLCHRIIVLYEGRAMGEFEASDENRGAISLAMSGLEDRREVSVGREAC